ncbi:MAG: UTP--glucose-1-phosphate uridylyltransferase [Phycisphaerales bacterium]|nr:UTP--glucose-1-phosphate uridylyltransferase [Phycisphaerales bacterium]
MSEIESMCGRLQQCGQPELAQALVAAPSLLEDLRRVDLDAIPSLVQRFVRSRPTPPEGDLAPATCVTTDAGSATDTVRLVDQAALQSAGEAMLAEGRVAVFTVAGGQGTRLGWNGPKGTFPASPVTGKPLFRLFAEQILAAQGRWGRPIRWYIMTSEANDAETRGFFLDNRCFGLDRRQIMMFPQGMMPAFDAAEGRVLLSDSTSLAMSPDGHGGCYAALLNSGALDQMEGRGIDAISYHQVDNPLAPVLDPVFLGLHARSDESSGEFSSKMVSKAGPDEKVGVFAIRGGAPGVVEYSDMTESQTTATDSGGHLRLGAGNVAMHVISCEFARRIADAGEASLPWHRADKKVAFYDPATSRTVTPEGPNAVKLERFVFDAMATATRPAILKVDRASQFAPIKNATGVDSAESSRQIQSALYGSWLESAGVRVPRDEDGRLDATIEISPLTALSAADLADVPLPEAITPGASVSL